jgi:hypothetical protein
MRRLDSAGDGTTHVTPERRAGSTPAVSLSSCSERTKKLRRAVQESWLAAHVIQLELSASEWFESLGCVPASSSQSRQRRWSLYGAQRAQPVAAGGKSDGTKNGSNERNRCRGLPPVAAGVPWLRSGSSPEEGSAKAPQSGALFREDFHDVQRGVGMEPFVQPSDAERRRKNSQTGRRRADRIRPFAQPIAAPLDGSRRPGRECAGANSRSDS